MATYTTIAATSKAVVGLLEAAASGDPEFGTVAFSICTSAYLQAPLTDRFAVTLYLYHVGLDASPRNAPGGVNASGVRLPPVLPLDLHYLLIARAKDAATQQRLLGWVCRVIAGTATFPAGVLNASSPELVFRTGESVDIIRETLTQQDLFDIWEVPRSNQQPSAAYVVRAIEIESTGKLEARPLVQATDFQYATVPT